MAATLFHRGPDDHGRWVDPRGLVALSHRRLSVVDLSTEGHQPMVSPDERWTLVYNGEAYNTAALRRTLAAEGMAFRGTSDTEVLLAAVQAWGVARALEAVEGMFALALWDRREGRLHLVRDRFGEKPLYYGWVHGVLAFASELKAFAPLPGFSPSWTGRPSASTSATTASRDAARSTGASPSWPRGPGWRSPSATRRAPCRPRALLVGAGGRPARGGPPAVGHPGAAHRSPGGGPHPLGGRPDGGRRAGRGVPVGRDRLERGGGAYAAGRGPGRSGPSPSGSTTRPTTSRGRRGRSPSTWGRTTPSCA